MCKYIQLLTYFWGFERLSEAKVATESLLLQYVFFAFLIFFALIRDLFKFSFL